MLRGNVVDASDWVLVGGYDRSNEALFGASPYGRGEKPLPKLDPMPDWKAKTEGYIVLGAKCPRPPAETMYTDALLLAVRLVRAPEGAPPYSGLKAYDVLVSALREEEYPEQADTQEDTPWFRYLCLLMRKKPWVKALRRSDPTYAEAAAGAGMANGDLRSFGHAAHRMPIRDRTWSGCRRHSPR